MKKLSIFLLTAMVLSSALFCCTTVFAQEVETEAVIERTAAEEYVFELSEEEELYFENLIFEEDVTISGEYAKIIFVNCEFSGDIILTSERGTRVILLESDVTGTCVFKNTTKEATLELPFPKFMFSKPVKVVAEDCIGAAFTFGDFEFTFNEETYSLANAELFYDEENPDAGFVPYEDQEANIFCLAQWWENGEKFLFAECEFDPTL